MILHKRRVLRALKGNGLRQIRQFLRIKARPKTPVLAQSVESAVAHHTGICRLLMRLMPELAAEGLAGKSVCEVGPGDCLATAALFAGLGACHITLVELQPPAVSPRQYEVLQRVRDQGIPVDLSILQGHGTTLSLDSSRISYYQKLMEDFEEAPAHDFLFSNNVMEHVEDLPGFFRSCAKVMKPGGRMLHIIDLGGHGEFEDPLPPLDFQTYSDWLYNLMYPPGHRATRRFVADYTSAASGAGFGEVTTHALRALDLRDVQSLQTRLRAQARDRSPEELAVIEFVLAGTKT